MEALYSAVKNYEEKGHTPCEVKTKTWQDASGETETVYITCKGQQTHLEIDLNRVHGYEDNAQFSEVLAYPEQVMTRLARADTTYTRGQAQACEAEEEKPVPLVAPVVRQRNYPVPPMPDLGTGRETETHAERGPQPTVRPDTAEDARREAAELANPSALVTIRAGEHLADNVLSTMAAHNRALCDQTVTVAGLTPRGLALYVPSEGQKFMAKNSQNYPRMCLVEDATKIVPGVPRYLLVYAYSENAFAGFQPVTQVNTATTPVSGSGTVMGSYGEVWNFTYSGTVEATEMDTIETPYVIQSHSLYLNAFDEQGNVVSRHSITASSQTGGNGASALGYNGAQLIALLWNNPSHLIKSVLKDVQKDSQKYSNK